MNAKNKLKTCDLIGIDAHFVYHAHRISINTESGWGLFKKADGSWGSKGSFHSNSPARVRVGSL